ncbi:HpcH/HpaI aldolase family protein [Rhodovulum sulfidophilum]|uniref:HpcH/HpaI aldolase family protein n=1 Tax=Rhodovulum sulfidophilum TaxID=35806 RepID=UPI00192071CD|nr:aldolase/citrate lyase family protein [Rhodovulum sulfidophilum]MBL3560202.1 aldolase [Rhodovulum sulfidophilum]
MSFRDKLLAGEVLIGTFVKTPSPHVVEILGLAGLDFAVIDQEHAPIGLAEMDMMAMAGRAVGLPLLSRRWGKGTDWIAPLMDLGMTGVMVPHVLDPEGAEAVCDAVKFARLKRGLSPSPRAGDYGGMSIPSYREKSDAETVVMVQIEDECALAHLEAIAAIKDVDLVFIGPADLSQSMGVAFPSRELDDAIVSIVEACKHAGCAVGLFVGDATAIPAWVEKGVGVFVCGSDQALLRKGAAGIMAAR